MDPKNTIIIILLLCIILIIFTYVLGMYVGKSLVTPRKCVEKKGYMSNHSLQP